MGQLQTYSGGCHCGKVRFQVEMDVEGKFVACNCSMCGRAGTLLTFVPAERFKLLAGEDAMTDYQFNKSRIHHLFCSTCGIKSFAKGTGPDGSEVRAVNARCIDGIDPSKLSIQHVDGRSF